MSSNDHEQGDTVVKTVNLLSGQIAGITYVVGYAIALGMNWADKDINAVGAIFTSMLSWINVGYLFIKHAV